MSNEHRTDTAPVHPAVLVVPRLRVQNANAISSPMTWGFPSITAFTGLMVALERRLGAAAGIRFLKVGVVCHGHETQTTEGGYLREFRLTRNPVLADGSTAGIVEEGRIHLEISLVFEVLLSGDQRGEVERKQLAVDITHALGGMRLAGGSVMPLLPTAGLKPKPAWLELLHPKADHHARQKQFRKIARRCLPGFVLIPRDDLLASRTAELQAADSQASPLDAWLDLCRTTTRAELKPPANGDGSEPTVDWVFQSRPGWIVPIPVGYVALSEHQPGTVRNARDTTTPFRFVETVWSMGQWISPHRLNDLDDMAWWADAPTAQGLYRCRTAQPFSPTPPAESELADETFE